MEVRLIEEEKIDFIMELEEKIDFNNIEQINISLQEILKNDKKGPEKIDITDIKGLLGEWND